MELSFLKHTVLTFLGSQGATQGPTHRKSKSSVPTPATSPRSMGPYPQGTCLGSIAGVILGLGEDLGLGFGFRLGPRCGQASGQDRFLIHFWTQAPRCGPHLQKYKNHALEITVRLPNP